MTLTATACGTYLSSPVKCRKVGGEGRVGNVGFVGVVRRWTYSVLNATNGSTRDAFCAGK